MDELKRKMLMLSVLGRKNELSLESLMVEFGQLLNTLEQAKQSVEDAEQALERCHLRIAESMAKQVDVGAIAALNQYAEKLSADLHAQQQQLAQYQQQVNLCKQQMKKQLSQGKAVDKALQGVSGELGRMVEKVSEINVQDNWLSRRRLQ